MESDGVGVLRERLVNSDLEKGLYTCGNIEEEMKAPLIIAQQARPRQD